MFQPIVDLRPPVSLSDVARAEVSLVMSCVDQDLRGGGAPVGVLAQEVVQRGAAGRGFGVPPDGAGGVHVRVFDGNCRVIGAGCTPVDVVGDAGGDVPVEVFAVDGPGCENTEVCRSGSCVELGPPEPDGGSDGGSDGGAAADIFPCDGTGLSCNQNGRTGVCFERAGEIECCAGCVIDGSCVSLNARDPANDCRQCIPDVRVDGYTTRSDGNLCSEDGADGACVGGVCVTS